MKPSRALLAAPLAVALCWVPLVAAPGAAMPSTTATAAAVGPRPAFQLPFACGTSWRLDGWDHSPSLDMVREPQDQTRGSTVVASAAGTVKEAGTDPNAGHYVLLDHGGNWFTVMIHLRDTPLVTAGATVRPGTPVGYVGASGNRSNGVNHLHYEQLNDQNGDGHLDWGVDASQDRTGYDGEDVPAVFAGRTYTGDGGEWRHVASANTCGTTSKHTITTSRAAPGYPSPTSTSSTGTLDAGTSYVYCKVTGRRITDAAGNTNRWWLRTDLDSGSPWQNQYVSAYYLSRWGNDEARDDAGAVIPDC